MTASTPLLLVDGHNLLWRAWYGFPARIRSRDKTRDLTGVFGFFALLRVAIRELPAASEVIVVFDGENAWGDRTAVDPDYKAHRPTDEDAMAPIKSLADVNRGLDAIGLRQLCLDTAEADDVIATLTRRCRRATPRRDVWIMSLDRDFYQLLDRRTRILNTARYPGRRVIDAAEVESRFGVRPTQWCDRTSLVGDPSDGIRGIHGVGTITAARLLAEGLTLDQLPDSGRLTGRIGDQVLAGLDDARRWRSMITLRTDLPLPRAMITLRPSAPLPPAPMIIETLELW
ncbi:5'-3' exonuclease [Microlunatus speluncae]|uniref:5'-3' exonuclease n=1 Tax=Microlunatus speluncae TaxID=2594267 RepID=UPI0012665B35|nr:5'-3' exonuclease H3TH domain-containing protein [Microlunatus speluncae]